MQLPIFVISAPDVTLVAPAAGFNELPQDVFAFGDRFMLALESQMLYPDEFFCRDAFPDRYLVFLFGPDDVPAGVLAHVFPDLCRVVQSAEQIGVTGCLCKPFPVEWQPVSDRPGKVLLEQPEILQPGRKLPEDDLLPGQQAGIFAVGGRLGYPRTQCLGIDRHDGISFPRNIQGHGCFYVSLFAIEEHNVPQVFTTDNIQPPVL